MFYRSKFVKPSPTAMQKTTLVFLSLKDLWEFRQAIQANYIEINTKNKSITCECSKAHIELAVEQFNAKIFRSSPSDTSGV